MRQIRAMYVLPCMGRSSWKTAIRCLEVALHPNTGDCEVLAAVNAFRRTADGTPLTQVCAALAQGTADSRTVASEAQETHGELDRLTRENLDLRGKLEAAETGRLVAVRQLRDAERRLHGLSGEIAELHRALAQATAIAAELQARRVAPPFRQYLAAALSGTAPGEARTLGSLKEAAPPPTPWTA